jgi:hypothetical protein
MADFPDNQRPEMPDDQQDGGWLTARMARASTGLKMLFFLSLGLLPLGLIAILASAQTARENQQQYAGDLRARLELKAERIDSALSRSMLMLRAAGGAMGPTDWDPSLCGKALQEIAQAENLPGRYALHSAGAPRCKTPGYQPPPFGARPGQRSAVMLDQTARALRFAIYDQSGAVIGSGELDAQQLATLTDLPGYSSPHQLILSGGGRQLLLSNSYEPTGSQSEIGLNEPIAGGALQIGMRTGAVPLRSAHILPILLPLLMLLYAGAVGWIIIDRLLVKPLAGMQRAIAAYRPGDKELALPSSRSPAREIGELGQAFERVTQTVARHEAELEAGLDRQTRLVREVHHRVKNNLQVVASLLNLHARGATSEDVSAAYASIQRRVDALAVVHRNHYAELEDNRGVALNRCCPNSAPTCAPTLPGPPRTWQSGSPCSPFTSRRTLPSRSPFWSPSL